MEALTTGGASRRPMQRSSERPNQPPIQATHQPTNQPPTQATNQSANQPPPQPPAQLPPLASIQLPAPLSGQSPGKLPNKSPSKSPGKSPNKSQGKSQSQLPAQLPGRRAGALAVQRSNHLWQLPLMILSLGTLGAAAGLFLDARPLITLNQDLNPAREMLRENRPDAAIASLSRLNESDHLAPAAEAQVHLLLAQAISQQQQNRPSQVPGALDRVIQETHVALAQGAKPTAEICRRLGATYELLGRNSEAIAQYRQAIEMEPARALPTLRRVIELQMESADRAAVDRSAVDSSGADLAVDLAGADKSLNEYLKTPGISDAERAWAEGQKAQLLIDRGQCAEAHRLLVDALRLDPDPMAQAEAQFRLGCCALKLGNAADAEKLIVAARNQFKAAHPLDARAAYVLGTIHCDRKDDAGAIELFNAALEGKPDAMTAVRARLARGAAKLRLGQNDSAAMDFRAAAEMSRSLSSAMKDESMSAMARAADAASAKNQYQSAVDILLCAKTIAANPPAELDEKLGAAYALRARQIDQSTVDATGAEQVRRQQLARDARLKSADEFLAYSRAKAGDPAAANTDANTASASLWKAMDLYEEAGAPATEAAALELFLSDRPADPQAPQALLRLGQTYQSLGQADKAIIAYQHLQSAFAATPQAKAAATPLAILYEAKGPDFSAQAEKLLLGVADDASIKNDDARRPATLELARLYFSRHKFTDAAARFEQYTQAYPEDEHVGQSLFLAGECHRKLAEQVDEKSSQAAQKKQELMLAADFYDRASERFRAAAPVNDVDRNCAAQVALRRADCAFEMGDYAQSIDLYTQIANAGEEPLAASVQIANAYFAMGKTSEAKAANERVKSLLHQLPASASGDGSIPIPRAYLEQWMRWSGGT